MDNERVTTSSHSWYRQIVWVAIKKGGADINSSNIAIFRGPKQACISFIKDECKEYKKFHFFFLDSR
jgi:hypothetical protein